MADNCGYRGSGAKSDGIRVASSLRKEKLELNPEGKGGGGGREARFRMARELTAVTQVGEGLGIGVGSDAKLGGTGKASKAQKSSGKLHLVEGCLLGYIATWGDIGTSC